MDETEGEAGHEDGHRVRDRGGSGRVVATINLTRGIGQDARKRPLFRRDLVRTKSPATRLVEFRNPEQSGGGSSVRGKGGGTRQRNRQLSDAQRQAMGLASEWLAFQFLRRRHKDFVDEACWISENRAQFFGGGEGDDTAGYDFLAKTPQTDWLYEVKSSLEDSGEFELTANELRVANGASKEGRRRYRILYVPHVFSPDRWCVFELPNPMGEMTRNRFTMVGRGSVRLRFKRR